MNPLYPTVELHLDPWEFLEMSKILAEVNPPGSPVNNEAEVAAKIHQRFGTKPFVNYMIVVDTTGRMP
jgi:hypothetical protein